MIVHLITNHCWTCIELLLVVPRCKTQGNGNRLLTNKPNLTWNVYDQAPPLATHLLLQNRKTKKPIWRLLCPIPSCDLKPYLLEEGRCLTRQKQVLHHSNPYIFILIVKLSNNVHSTNALWIMALPYSELAFLCYRCSSIELNLRTLVLKSKFQIINSITLNAHIL